MYAASTAWSSWVGQLQLQWAKIRVSKTVYIDLVLRQLQFCTCNDDSGHDDSVHYCILVQPGQAESANYCATVSSELSYVSAKLYRSNVDWRCIVHGTICRGPWQLSLCIACNNATNIELHVHTYAVGVADIAAREGSPHNVLHSSSIVIHYYTQYFVLLHLIFEQRMATALVSTQFRPSKLLAGVLRYALLALGHGMQNSAS